MTPIPELCITWAAGEARDNSEVFGLSHQEGNAVSCHFVHVTVGSPSLYDILSREVLTAM
jgi:hypothetical protein